MQQNWRLQFGVGLLLFAMLVVAGYFYGLNRGDTARINTTLSDKTYAVGNLLDENQQIDEQLQSVASLIRSTIAPDSWLEAGGIASLQTYPSNRSIVVLNQYGVAHEKISDLLDSLDKLKNAKVTVVKYDVSQIVSGGSSKSHEEQLNAVCSILRQMMSTGDVIGPVSFDLDSDNLLISATAKVHAHEAIAHYVDQLQFARVAISQIDG